MKRRCLRRKFLSSIGVAGIIAGCASDTGNENQPPDEISDEETETAAPGETQAQETDPDDLDGYVQPQSDPEPIDELVCDDEEFERHAKVYDDVNWGVNTVDGDDEFALRVNDLAFKRGDEIGIELTNVINEPRGVPNRDIYNFEVFTTAGWQDVRGWAEGEPSGESLPYTEEIHDQEPGDGYRWSFELSEEGVIRDHIHEEYLTVCPELPYGRYRFVFVHAGLAVGFEVVE